MTPYVAGVVKRLTRRIVAPLCVGSSPTTRPIFFYLKTGNEGPWPADSFIWGYRQAVRQRTLTPLSVVRLHLPLPVIKSCSFPLQDFLRGNKSLSKPVVPAPFGGCRHHLPAPLGSVSLDSQSPTTLCESSSLATTSWWDYGCLTMGRSLYRKAWSSLFCPPDGVAREHDS